MKKYLDVLKKVNLFKGIDESDLAFAFGLFVKQA